MPNTFVGKVIKEMRILFLLGFLLMDNFDHLVLTFTSVSFYFDKSIKIHQSKD